MKIKPKSVILFLLILSCKRISSYHEESYFVFLLVGENPKAQIAGVTFSMTTELLENALSEEKLLRFVDDNTGNSTQNLIVIIRDATHGSFKPTYLLVAEEIFKNVDKSFIGYVTEDNVKYFNKMNYGDFELLNELFQEDRIDLVIQIKGEKILISNKRYYLFSFSDGGSSGGSVSQRNTD